MPTLQPNPSHNDSLPIPLLLLREKPRYKQSDFWLEIIVKLVVTCIIFIIISCVQMAAASTGVEMEKVTQGTLFYKSAHDNRLRSAPMLKTNVELHITGLINRAHVTQSFHNGSNDWVEGIYVFPLPENAAVDRMRIRIGERIIEGKIKERAQAKRVYEQAKAQGKRASLLEQERPNMFTTSVANIGPGEKVDIEIEFQQTLRYDQGQLSMRFPLAITPRYIPGKAISDNSHRSESKGPDSPLSPASPPASNTASASINGSSPPTDQVPDADRVTPLVALGKKINPVSLSIALDAGFPVDKIESSYHKIEQHMLDDGRYSINLAQGDVPADRDFELTWKPVRGNAPRAAMFQETVNGEHYYLVMMLPPEQEANKPALAREVIYVIDTSGSMGGVSIRQARKALLLALERLRPNDSFNVIQFNSSTRKLFARSKPATAQNISEARHYVSNLQADGGTEMMEAMRAALSKDEDSQRLRQVIFLTDGAIGNEDALFEHIRHYLGSSRLFTVGIGSAPNSHFMRKAAQFGRGTFTYIGDVNEVAGKMQALFAKLDTPMMRDLNITHYLNDFEMWPQTLPDLYAAEPLIMTASSTMNHGEVTLLGKRNDDAWQARIHLQSASYGKGIGKLWARNKIDALIDSLHDGADKDNVRNSVIDIALTHHLVSKYTSLVAVDVSPVGPLDKTLASKAMPTNLPHGQIGGKIFGLQAKTGTTQYLLLSAGSVFMIFALVLMLFRKLSIKRHCSGVKVT